MKAQGLVPLASELKTNSAFGVARATQVYAAAGVSTADSGGTMYPVGRAIAGAMASETRKLNVGASTGSEKNIADLSSGEIDLGLVTADAAYDALQAGTAEGLRAIGPYGMRICSILQKTGAGTSPAPCPMV